MPAIPPIVYGRHHSHAGNPNDFSYQESRLPLPGAIINNRACYNHFYSSANNNRRTDNRRTDNYFYGRADNNQRGDNNRFNHD